MAKKKLSITPEIKAQVLAPYLNQKIKVGNTVSTLVLFRLKPDYVDQSKVILKPLSHITTKDAVAVYKIIHKCEPKDCIADTHAYIEGYLDDEIRCDVYQYLQYKGYDLPHYLLGGKTLKEAGLAVYNK